MTALAAALPLLVIPFFGDQALVGKAVERRGAGLMLTPESTASEIRASVERLLSEPQFGQAAAAVAAEIGASGGAEAAADVLEALRR